MKKILIFGHKRPDTDSVMAAIGLSYLKNRLGENTEPRVLGMIHQETQYALDYFGLKAPLYLNDVKLQVKDVSYHKGFFLSERSSMYDGYQAMLREDLTGLPLVKENGTFSGLLTMKDLSKTLLDVSNKSLYTSYDNILRILKGEEIYRATEEVVGNFRLFSSEVSDSFTSKDILIVEKYSPLVRKALLSGISMLILCNHSDIFEEDLSLAKANRVNIIRTSYDVYFVARIIFLSNYIKIMTPMYNPTKFLETDFVSDVVDKNKRLKHTNYPVVDKYNKCLGLLKITDLNEKEPKQVILVDHNEKLQSVDGLEEAEIVEILDHHNLGNITTLNPVNFQNMAVGSTCTILYFMYQERKVTIPKEIAGALLSGILSDTLILRSPTTTEKDIFATTNLAEIAHVSIEKYGLDLFKSGTSLEGMSKEEVLYNDYKVYTVNEKSFAIGQIFTTNFQQIEKELSSYIDVLNQVSEANNYVLVALYVTDIIKNGSYVLFNDKGETIINLAYQTSIDEGAFIKDCLSRKKHIVPILMEVLEN